MSNGPSSMPSIAAIVPTYQRRKELPRTIESLLADDAFAEIVVVVDGCRDGSLEYLDSVAERDHRIKPMFIENRGEMGAREAGAEVASTELVLFIDDDVLVEPGIAAGHAEHHRVGRDLVVLGFMPVVLPDEPDPGRFATYIYADDYEEACEAYEADARNVLQRLWGGNFSMRRNDCLRVGLSSDAYRERYHPDRDFGIRCFKVGLRGKFDRSLRAHHMYQRSIEGFCRDAHSQGFGASLLHEIHEEILGPAPSDRNLRGLPKPAVAVMAMARNPWGQRSITSLLRLAISAMIAKLGPSLLVGRDMALWITLRLARLLRRVQQQAGALERIANSTSAAQGAAQASRDGTPS